jgi:hypothetical protein
MLPEQPVPLADDSVGCSLGEQIRRVQNGSEVYSISLNRDYLRQLDLYEQGARTKHAMAMRPVVIERPAYVIQPVGVLDE